MQNLGLTEEDFNRVSDIEQIFQTSENLKDHRFGEIALLTSEQNPNVIIMRKEKFSQDENECCKDILEAKQRLKMEHPCILQMPDFSTKLVQREQGYQEMLVSGYYEYPDWDLEREIEKRIIDKNYFQPDVLLKITFEILSAMSYLQSQKIIHGDLRPKYISFSNDMEFSYQLCDRLGDPYPPNKVQINNLKKNKPLYLSPILFKSLSLRKKRIRHNPYKSEVFSLGIIVLEAGILQSVQKIYDKKQKQINVEEMLNYIEIFMNRYGEHDILRESLIWMLDLNGHNRKDPKTIYQMIQDYLEQMNQQGGDFQQQQDQLEQQHDQQQNQDIVEQEEIEVEENIQTENLQYQKNDQDQNENSFDRIRKERKFDINEEEYENLNEDNEDNQQEEDQQYQNKQEQFDFNKVPVLDSFDLRNSQQDQMKINLNLEVKHQGDEEDQKDVEDRIEWKNDNKYQQNNQQNYVQTQQYQEQNYYKRDLDNQNKEINNELLDQKVDNQKEFQKQLLSNFDEVNATSQLQTQNSREVNESKLNEDFKQKELEKLYNEQQQQQRQQYLIQQKEVQNNDQRDNFKDNNLHLYQNLTQNNQTNMDYQPQSLQQDQINQVQQNNLYQDNQQTNQKTTNPIYQQKKQYTEVITYKPQQQNNQQYQNNNIQYQDYKKSISQNSHITQNNYQINPNHNNLQTPIVSQQTSYIKNNNNQYSMNKDLMKFTDNSIPNSQQIIKNDFEPQLLNQSQTQPQNQVHINKDAPLSIQINQKFEQNNIYENRNSQQIIEKPKRRTVKAKSIYPFNDPRYSNQSQREHRTENSNSVKREYYVSPTRLREFKESISREPRKQSVNSHTFDYEIKKEGTKNVRRVILSKNNDSIFKNIVQGNYPEINSIYNQPKLEEDWKARYGSNIEIVQQKKNYQVFRLSHSKKQDIQHNQHQNNFQFNQFNKMKFSGWIEYNGKKTPSEITIDQHTEDSFYTEGSDSTGNFTMTAQIASSGRIDIKKQYNGKHLVLMFGRVTKNEDFISEFHGCWEIKNSATGDFEYKLLNQL